MDDDQVEQPEIVLEQGPPFWLRLGLGVFGIWPFFWVAAQLTAARLPALDDSGWLLVLAYCGLTILLRFFFGRYINWTIGDNEISINYDYGDLDTIRSGDILEIAIRDQPGWFGDRFRIKLSVAGGRRVESPRVRDARRAHELKAEIARRLNVPHEHVTPPN